MHARYIIVTNLNLHLTEIPSLLLQLKVVLFIRKLREILDNCEECRGKYELVLISGNDTNEIADVLVGMHNAANIELDDGADD